MPKNNFRTPDGDIENESYITEPWLVDNLIGDQLWGWGYNNPFHLLGTNDTLNRRTPITTLSGNTQWKSVSKGQQIVSAIKTNGSLWVWGKISYLGINISSATAYMSTPVTTFAGGNDWKEVSCGLTHIGAIKYDGSLWVWGNNGSVSGNLGTNDTTDRLTPVTTFAGGNDWKQVSCNDLHTSAIKTDGSLWMWGDNTSGKLGTNDTITRSTPVTTFAGGNDWKQVSCGRDCSAAIKTDGSLWTWGKNDFGSLAINDNITRSTPVTTISGGNDWKQVAVSKHSMAAIKTDGSLWVWGNNGIGNLGTNDAITRSTPVTTFAGGYDWKQVSIGENDNNIAAVKTDGSLWTWGFGNYGALGTNTFRDSSTPVTTYAGGNNWKQVSCANYATFAVTSGPDY